MMINKQDEKILLRVKDNLTDCTNTLHNRKYAIENMMMRFSDLRRDVIDEVGDESSMYVDLFDSATILLTTILKVTVILKLLSKLLTGFQMMIC